MDNLLRFTWLRRSGAFWAAIVLIFAALFAWSTPVEAASRSSRTRYRSATTQRVIKKRVRNRSQRLRNRRIAKSRRIRTSRRGNRRWIQVDLSSQRLIAWEGGRRVYSMRISSGKRSTPTRLGRFAVQTKLRSTRMRGRTYNVPNVPYTMYYSGGYAIHGAYWHKRFGTPVSHGCVNLPVSQARKLYRWAKVGTPVVVQR